MLVHSCLFGSVVPIPGDLGALWSERESWCRAWWPWGFSSGRELMELRLLVLELWWDRLESTPV